MVWILEDFQSGDFTHQRFWSPLYSWVMVWRSLSSTAIYNFAIALRAISVVFSLILVALVIIAGILIGSDDVIKYVYFWVATSLGVLGANVEISIRVWISTANCVWRLNMIWTIWLILIGSCFLLSAIQMDKRLVFGIHSLSFCWRWNNFEFIVIRRSNCVVGGEVHLVTLKLELFQCHISWNSEIFRLLEMKMRGRNSLLGVLELVLGKFWIWGEVKIES